MPSARPNLAAFGIEEDELSHSGHAGSQPQQGLTGLRERGAESRPRASVRPLGPETGGGQKLPAVATEAGVLRRSCVPCRLIVRTVLVKQTRHHLFKAQICADLFTCGCDYPEADAM